MNERPLNIEYIQKKISDGYHNTEIAKDKDLVLIIGNTGVGKSTTANYLLGHRMIERKINGRSVIETIDKPTFSIGHQVTAETLYATPVMSNAFSWLLTDCPGFQGNKAVEDRVIESISIELAIRSAMQIKGVLILISMYSIMETKLEELRGLMKTLISLFKDPIEMVKYSTFLITKKNKHIPDNEAREETTGAMSYLIKHCIQQRKILTESNTTSAEGLTSADYDKIETFFSALLKESNEIIFVNPLDIGESRDLIINKINNIKLRKGIFRNTVEGIKTGLQYMAGYAPKDGDEFIKPITIEDFNFSTYDEYRVKFNKAMYDWAHDGHELIQVIQNCVKKVQNTIFTRRDNENRIETLKKLKTNLESTQNSNESIELSLKTRENIINQNLELIIIKNTKELPAIQTKILDLTKELEQIDNDTPLLFRESRIDKNVILINFFGWEQMDFNADTGDSNIPLIKIEKELKNGEWYDKIDDSNNGKYSITYKSNYHARPAFASVKAYIRTKDDPGNKIRIKEIKDLLEQHQKEFEQILEGIAKLESDNEIIQSDIEKMKSGKLSKEEDRSARVAQCQRDIHDYTGLIAKSEEEIKMAKNIGSERLNKLLSEKHKFDILNHIASKLEFPSLLIKQFIAEYKFFLKELEKYKTTLFEDEEVDIDSMPIYPTNVTDAYRDPISGQLIKSPVATKKRGTLFDEHSLLKKFEVDQTKPYHHKHQDNSIEIIEYLEWVKIEDVQRHIERILKLKDPSDSELLVGLAEKSNNQLKEEKEQISQDIEKLKQQLEDKKHLLSKINRELLKREPSSISEIRGNHSNSYSKILSLNTLDIKAVATSDGKEIKESDELEEKNESNSKRPGVG